MTAQLAVLDSQDLGLFSPFDVSGVAPGTDAIAIRLSCYIARQPHLAIFQTYTNEVY